MQARGATGIRGRQRPLVVPAVLACWVLGALVFTVLPAGSGARTAAALALSWASLGFSAAVLLRAATVSGEAGRTFWGLAGAGVVLRLAGDVAWGLAQVSGSSASVAPFGVTVPDVAYVLSYALLIAAMLRLISLVYPRFTVISALDSGAIVLSVGTLIWFLLLGPSAAEAGFEGWRDVVAALFQPVCDSALLFLGLVAVSSRDRPRFVGMLVLGFAVFLAADAVYLLMRAAGPYESGNWPEVLWALGGVVVGLAAYASPAVPNRAPQTERLEPWRILSFWLGPLSPPLHFGAMLLWGAYHPPLPAYVLDGAAALLLYLAARVGIISYMSRHLDRERQAATRRLEEARVLEEMRGTVEGGLGSVTVSVLAALEADRRGEPAEVRELLRETLQTTREAEWEISRPYEELAASESAPAPGAFLRHRAARFEEYFGIRTHVDFRVPLESLTPVEVAAVNRVAVEAFWNVARHSGARNMYVESRRVGSVFVFRVRDDGRGFDASDPPPGMGLPYLLQRAREVGAHLDVISTPGSGATVQVRFERRGRWRTDPGGEFL